MAAVEIDVEQLPRDANGYNLSDSTDFTTLVAGDSNGVTFLFDSASVIILKNDTGGAAVFKFLVPTPTKYTTYEVVITPPTLSVATGKQYLLRLDELFKNTTTKKVIIACDVAGKVLVVNP